MVVGGQVPMGNKGPIHARPGPTSTSPRRVLSVLVVDDCPHNVATMAILLRLAGAEVRTAHDGPAALLTARAKQPDVVLLDISMPRMSGYEVARQMRGMFDDEVTLIAVTANGFDEARKHCFDAGFDHHFVKPADPEKVEELIRELASSL